MSTTDPDLLVAHSAQSQNEPVGKGEGEGLPAEEGKRRPWGQAFKAIFPTFLITRFVMVLLTYFGVVLFTIPNYAHQSLSWRTLLFSWFRWDAIRFNTIASQGYIRLDYSAFFPLYPGLENLLARVLHIYPFAAGMLISNLALLAMMVLLYRLVETEFDVVLAKRTVLYQAVFPTAFFFFAGYNESLFILFMLISLYAMRRSNWWLAGIAGLLAILTRSSGWIIAVAFLYEFVRLNYPRVRQSLQERHYLQSVGRVLPILWGLLIPLGLLIFIIYLYPIFHDPLAFSDAQVKWRMGLTFPLYAPLLALYNIFTMNPLTFFTAHNLIDLSALLLAVTLLVMCFVGPYRFARDQWVFPFVCLLSLLIPLLYPGLGGLNPLPSVNRFFLECFPCFIILAKMGKREWFHNSYLMLALPMLAFMTFQFLTGHWTV